MIMKTLFHLMKTLIVLDKWSEELKPTIQST
jgi:hypothetical protein